MKNNPRDTSLLSQEQRTAAINSIIDYFSSERDEEIGIIAAEDMLDMFLETGGSLIYNKGIDDTKSFLKKRMEENELDLDLQLKKSI